MANIGRLSVQIGVSLNKFRSDLNQALQTLNSNTAKMKRSMDGLATAAKLTGAVIASAFVVKEVAQMAFGVAKLADEYKQLEAKIKNSLDTTAEFKSVFQQLTASSNRTGMAIDAVTQAFVRLRPAAKDLGVSNKDLIRFNETFQKMGVLAGATGTEVENAMIQLSQGLASGTLRGDELRSIMEQMPQVARTVADSMGIPFKDFKKAAEDGRISAEAVFKAIMDKSTEVDAQFAKLPVSIERSVNAVTNTLKQMLGEIDKNAGASQGLSRAIQGVNGFLVKHKDEILRVTNALVGLIKSIAGFAAKLAKLMYNLTPVGPALKALFDRFTEGKSVFKTTESVINALAKAFDSVSNRIEKAIKAFKRFQSIQKSQQAQGWETLKKLADPFGQGQRGWNNIKRLKKGQPVANFTDSKTLLGGTSGDDLDALARSTEELASLPDFGKKGTESLQAVINTINSMGSQFEETMTNMVTTGKFSFTDMVNSMIADIARLIIRLSIVTPLVNAISGFFQAPSRNLGPTVTSAMGGLPVAEQIQLRASGGPVGANKPYVVGEEGMELFVPRSAGTIIPNHALGGGMAQPVVNVTINAVDAQSVAQLLTANRGLIGQFGVQAVQKVMNKRGRSGPLDPARA